jgi:hypothetical protein
VENVNNSESDSRIDDERESDKVKNESDTEYDSVLENSSDKLKSLENEKNSESD